MRLTWLYGFFWDEKKKLVVGIFEWAIGPVQA